MQGAGTQRWRHNHWLWRVRIARDSHTVQTATGEGYEPSAVTACEKA